MDRYNYVAKENNVKNGVHETGTTSFYVDASGATAAGRDAVNAALAAFIAGPRKSSAVRRELLALGDAGGSVPVDAQKGVYYLVRFTTSAGAASFQMPVADTSVLASGSDIITSGSEFDALKAALIPSSAANGIPLTDRFGNVATSIDSIQLKP